MEADKFDKTWLVLSQSPANADGFSAVLLQNHQSGEKVLAIRGTEPGYGGADYIEDLINVLALGAVAGMSQYRSLEAYYAQIVSSGKLGTSGQVVVTGHSLGGFLAQAFVAHHDETINTAYTFNAPGMHGVIGQLLEFMGITDASKPNAKIANVRTADGVSAIARLRPVMVAVSTRRELAFTDPAANDARQACAASYFSAAAISAGWLRERCTQ